MAEAGAYGHPRRLAVPAVRPRLVRYQLRAARPLGDDATGVLALRHTGDAYHDPAAAVTAGWLTGGLLLTAWLKHRGHREMCAVLRTPPYAAVVAVFVLHLARVLGRWDPFCALGRLIPIKEPS